MRLNSILFVTWLYTSASIGHKCVYFRTFLEISSYKARVLTSPRLMSHGIRIDKIAVVFRGESVLHYVPHIACETQAQTLHTKR